MGTQSLSRLQQRQPGKTACVLRNREARHVPMDSALTPLFRGYARRSNSDFIFPGSTGGRLTDVHIGFRNARERAGIADLHFQLRHNGAFEKPVTV